MWIEKNKKEKNNSLNESVRSPLRNGFTNFKSNKNLLQSNSSLNRTNRKNNQDYWPKARKRNVDSKETAIKERERITNFIDCSSRINRSNGISKRVYTPSDILKNGNKDKEETTWKEKKREQCFGTFQDNGFGRNNEVPKDSFLNTYQSNITIGRKQIVTDPYPPTQTQSELTEPYITGKLNTKNFHILSSTNGKLNLHSSTNKNATTTSLNSWINSRPTLKETEFQDSGRNYTKGFNLSGSLYNEKMHSQTYGYTNHNNSINTNNTLTNLSKKELLNSELESNDFLFGSDRRNIRKETQTLNNLYYSQNFQTQEMLSSRSKRPYFHSFNRSMNGSELGMNMEEKKKRFIIPDEKEEQMIKRNTLTLQQKIQKDIPQIIKSTVENHLNHSIDNHIQNITEKKVVQYVGTNLNQMIQQNLHKFNINEVKKQINEYVCKELEAHGNEISEEKRKESEHKIQEEILKNMDVATTELKEKVHIEIEEKLKKKIDYMYSNVNKQVDDKLNSHVTHESVKMQNSIHKCMNEELKRKTEMIQSNIHNKLHNQVHNELINHVESIHNKISEHISKELKKNIEWISKNMEEFSERQIEHKIQMIKTYLKDTLQEEIGRSLNIIEKNQKQQQEKIEEQLEKQIGYHIENKVNKYKSMISNDIQNNIKQLQESIHNEMNHTIKQNLQEIKIPLVEDMIGKVRNEMITTNKISFDTISIDIAKQIESLRTRFEELQEDKNVSKEVEEILEKKQNQMIHYLDIMKTNIEETNENICNHVGNEINKGIINMNRSTKECIQEVVSKENQIKEDYILHKVKEYFSEDLTNGLTTLIQKEMKTLKSPKGNQTKEVQEVVRSTMFSMNKRIFSAIDGNTVAILNSKESIIKYVTDCISKVTKLHTASYRGEEDKQKLIETYSEHLNQVLKQINQSNELQNTTISNMIGQIDIEGKEASYKIHEFLKEIQKSLQESENKMEPLNNQEFINNLKKEMTSVIKEELTHRIKEDEITELEGRIKELIVSNHETMSYLFKEVLKQEKHYNTTTTNATITKELNQANLNILSQVENQYDLIRNYMKEYVIRQEEKITDTLKQITNETTTHPNNNLLLNRLENIENALTNGIIETTMLKQKNEFNPTEMIQTVSDELKQNKEIIIKSIIHKMKRVIKKKKTQPCISTKEICAYNNSLMPTISNKNNLKSKKKRLNTLSVPTISSQNTKIMDAEKQKIKSPFVVSYILDEQNRLVEISKYSDKNTITKVYI